MEGNSGRIAGVRALEGGRQRKRQRREARASSSETGEAPSGSLPLPKEPHHSSRGCSRSVIRNGQMETLVDVRQSRAWQGSSSASASCSALPSTPPSSCQRMVVPRVSVTTQRRHSRRRRRHHISPATATSTATASSNDSSTESQGEILIKIRSPLVSGVPQVGCGGGPVMGDSVIGIRLRNVDRRSRRQQPNLQSPTSKLLFNVWSSTSQLLSRTGSGVITRAREVGLAAGVLAGLTAAVAWSAGRMLPWRRGTTIFTRSRLMAFATALFAVTLIIFDFAEGSGAACQALVTQASMEISALLAAAVEAATLLRVAAEMGMELAVEAVRGMTLADHWRFVCAAGGCCAAFYASGASATPTQCGTAATHATSILQKETQRLKQLELVATPGLLGSAQKLLRRDASLWPSLSTATRSSHASTSSTPHSTSLSTLLPPASPATLRRTPKLSTLCVTTSLSTTSRIPTSLSIGSRTSPLISHAPLSSVPPSTTTQSPATLSPAIIPSRPSVPLTHDSSISLSPALLSPAPLSSHKHVFLSPTPISSLSSLSMLRSPESIPPVSFPTKPLSPGSNVRSLSFKRGQQSDRILLHNDITTRSDTSPALSHDVPRCVYEKSHCSHHKSTLEANEAPSCTKNNPPQRSVRRNERVKRPYRNTFSSSQETNLRGDISSKRNSGESFYERVKHQRNDKSLIVGESPPHHGKRSIKNISVFSNVPASQPEMRLKSETAALHQEGESLGADGLASIFNSCVGNIDTFSEDRKLNNERFPSRITPIGSRSHEDWVFCYDQRTSLNSKKKKKKYPWLEDRSDCKIVTNHLQKQCCEDQSCETPNSVEETPRHDESSEHSNGSLDIIVESHQPDDCSSNHIMPSMSIENSSRRPEGSLRRLGDFPRILEDSSRCHEDSSLRHEVSSLQKETSPCHENPSLSREASSLHHESSSLRYEGSPRSRESSSLRNQCSSRRKGSSPQRNESCTPRNDDSRLKHCSPLRHNSVQLGHKIFPRHLDDLPRTHRDLSRPPEKSPCLQKLSPRRNQRLSQCGKQESIIKSSELQLPNLIPSKVSTSMLDVSEYKISQISPERRTLKEPITAVYARLPSERPLSASTPAPSAVPLRQSRARTSRTRFDSHRFPALAAAAAAALATVSSSTSSAPSVTTT